jgi:tRNA dimethylallyltransferase
LDLIEPGESYSAAKFKDYALAKIADIQKRGKLPIIVGGTGLYIDGVLFDFNFIEGEITGSELAEASIEHLQDIIKAQGYQMPVNERNRRHLVRTIERAGQIGSRSKLRPGTLLIGLMPDDNHLKMFISDRADQIFSAGVIVETKKLTKKYGSRAVRETGGIVYRICLDALEDVVNVEECLNLFKSADWQYARRQKTWFRRNKFIQWFDNSEDALISVKHSLNT